MRYNLYLLRHAKSDWSVSGQKDIDRELNNRGGNDAPRIGRKLYDLGVNPDMIICSPARRTKMTAMYVCEQLHYDMDRIVYNEDIYEASTRTLLHAINGFDRAWSSVMMIGHNPGFTYLAEYLSKRELGNIPTSGVVNLEFEADGWEELSGGAATVKWFIYPKMLT